jgi:hypothetical protein
VVRGIEAQVTSNHPMFLPPSSLDYRTEPPVPAYVFLLIYYLNRGSEQCAHLPAGSNYSDGSAYAYSKAYTADRLGQNHWMGHANAINSTYIKVHYLQYCIRINRGSEQSVHLPAGTNYSDGSVCLASKA